MLRANPQALLRYKRALRGGIYPLHMWDFLKRPETYERIVEIRILNWTQCPRTIHKRPIYLN